MFVPAGRVPEDSVPPVASGPDGSGWADPEWAQAAGWIDAALARAGYRRCGPWPPPRIRPWSFVAEVPTDRGAVWFKASRGGSAFEAGLYEVLQARVPAHVLPPLATRPQAGWVLLPDGGAALRGSAQQTGDPAALADAVIRALVAYAQLQRTLLPHTEELLAVGVADMRPAVMLRRFDEALDLITAGTPAAGDADTTRLLARIGDRRPEVASWCARLAASAVPAGLDHNDLHGGNILISPGGSVRFFDWGDAVLAHPFASLLMPSQALGGPGPRQWDHPRVRQLRARYLDQFRDLAPDEDLELTVVLACRVAAVARALVWHRAVAAPGGVGAPIPADWASAPLRTLATVLDDHPPVPPGRTRAAPGPRSA